jgi:hypothetical protein
MSDREHVAREVLKYIRSGMNDSSARDKFGPAYEGLQQLFQELANAGFMGESAQESVAGAKKRINAREIVNDIRAGSSRAELMVKFGLTRTELQRAVRKLVQAKTLNLGDLPADLVVLHDSDVPGDTRREDRYGIDFELPIWEEKAPEHKGQVIDITERGIGIIGLDAVVGQVKKLVVFSEEFLEIEPFSFEATCRWAKNEEQTGDCVSGFQISRIEDEDLIELRKVIELLRI